MSRIDANGADTYYERKGSGRPIVFAHAGFVDRRMWEPQVEALKDDFEVITYDIRAHGETGGTDAEEYSIDLFAADLNALIEELELDDPVVCGLSLGGMVAQKYAEVYADEGDTVIVADAMVLRPHGLKRRLQSVYLWRAAQKAIGIVGLERTVDFMGWLEEKVHGDDVGSDDKDLEDFSREVLEGMSTDEALKLIDAIVDRDYVDYEAIDADVTIIYGENEPSDPFTAPWKRPHRDRRRGPRVELRQPRRVHEGRPRRARLSRGSAATPVSVGSSVTSDASANFSVNGCGFSWILRNPARSNR